jgi:hypothetical protein
MNRSPLRAFLLIPPLLACFALSPQARAVCQEGCLTNQNTVLGEDALLNHTSTNNTAIGFNALLETTTGTLNTATGWAALVNNTTGSYNTATGEDALGLNTTGFFNTATGASALVNNTTGESNTAIGVSALFNNRGGDNNIAVGAAAGINRTTGSNNIDIGNAGVAGESNRIRIGTVGTQKASFIAGIAGATVPGGVGVIVGNNGKLGTVVSSKRFKDDIKPMDKESETILALKPVTFRYKKELDPEGIPQFGLVAEDVEKVNPALVARDADEKAYTVRYEAVNAMLLNEFLKEHRRNETQQKQIEALTAMVKEQAAQIQKVSAALEARESSPQIVLNNQ